jgi:hypothetical protein
LRDKLFEGQAVKTYSGGKPNYTEPIEKEWVGLTDEEMKEIWDESGWYVTVFKKVEAKLKEKNNG